MKKALPFLAILLSTGLTFACKDDDDDRIVVEDAPPSPTEEAPTLTQPAVELTLPGHTFQTPCLPVTFYDLDSTKRLLSLETSGAFTATDDIFLGDSCGVSPYLTLETSGTYVDGGKQTADATLANIDFAVTESYLTVKEERMLITFNANSYCGKADWVIDEKVSLKDLNCEFIPARIGSTIQDVYAIEDSSLYFGGNVAWTAKAGQPRPTGVDRNVKYELPSP